MTNHDPKTLRLCAGLAREVYTTGTPVGDLQYLCHREQGEMYVAIRGTDNIHNWMRNLYLLPPALTPKGHLGHRGVFDGYRELWKYVMVDIRGASSVILTGHSLGGGECLPWGEAYGFPLITFGAMRAYIRGMAPRLDHLRIINDDDPVPGLLAVTCGHDCPPGLIMRDRDDALYEVKDHEMALYERRLNKYLDGREGT